MKMIVEGVMDGNLPWGLVFIGVFVAIVIEILGIPVLPVAIGLYLPLELSSTIMIGGVIRWYVDKKAKGSEINSEAGSGILFCSGMIAGEGLVGIILAILAVFGIGEMIDLSASVDTGLIGGLILMVAMIAAVMKFAMTKEPAKADGKDSKKES